MSDVVQSDHDNIVEISPPSVNMKESIREGVSSENTEEEISMRKLRSHLSTGAIGLEIVVVSKMLLKLSMVSIIRKKRTKRLVSFTVIGFC